MDRKAPPAGLLTLTAAADALGVTRRTVYTWMDRGVLPFVTYGLRRYIRPETIEHFIQPGQALQDDKRRSESYNRDQPSAAA